MKALRVLFSSFLGGILLSIGYLASIVAIKESALFGSVLFSIGLIGAMVFELNIFTDRVGCIYEGSSKPEKKVAKIFLTFLGNCAGAAILGFATSRMYVDETKLVLNQKINSDILSVLISSIICGILIYAACHAYRRQSGGIAGIAIIAVVSAAIPLCGFEHAVSNVFLVSKFVYFYENALINIAFSALGNLIGALVFSTLYELKKNSDSNSHHRHHHRHRHHHSSSEKVEEFEESPEKQ